MNKYKQAIVGVNYIVPKKNQEKDEVLPITIWTPSCNLIKWFQDHNYCNTYQYQNKKGLIKELDGLYSYLKYFEQGRFLGIRLGTDGNYLSYASPFTSTGWYANLQEVLLYCQYLERIQTKQDLIQAKLFLTENFETVSTYPNKIKQNSCYR